jgi:NitT/TauT family transport system ATP-binding protein
MQPTLAQNPAISVRGVSFGYGGNAPTVLKDTSIDIEKGEFVSIVGPSGCGKSTLLYLIGGFVPLAEGVIDIKGRPVSGPSPDCGIVFQQFALFPWKTVLGNVLYGLEKARKLNAAERLERARELIRLVQLEDFESSYPTQLSGGMRQRAAIARTLAVDPDILLMDEPFGALDAQTRSVMQRELRDIWMRTKKTVVFVTHDVREAVYLSERIVVLGRRPARIKAVVETRFEKQGELDAGEEFDSSVRRIWNLVRSEFESIDEAHP